MLSEFLAISGAMVSTAQNGEETIRKVHADTFDLIFMDVQMPVLDAYAASRRLKSEGSKIPSPPMP